MNRTLFVSIVVALAVGTFGALFVSPTRAGAHPLGNFTVNRYARLDLYREAIRVRYALDFAEIPTLQLVQRIDRDRDGKASPDELAAYRLELERELAEGIDLTVGGRRLALRALSSQASFAAGQGGLDVLRIDVMYAATAPAETHRLDVQFADRNYGDRLGWKEIVVRPSAGSDVAVPEQLTRDASDALQRYPAELLSSVPDIRAVTFAWAPTSGPQEPTAALLTAVAVPSRPADRFASLLERERSALLIVTSLFAAFGFGALHALGPGHGKAVVAAYLVGSKGTVRDAITLGLTVTATHTSMVYLLGFATTLASAFFLPERLYLYIGLASGVSVVVMGISLFLARSGLLRRTSGNEVHRHGLFSAAHSHGDAHTHIDAHDRGEAHAHRQGASHDHDYVHPHAQPHEAHTHEAHGAEALPDIPRVHGRALLALGVVGGLLPCPSALVVMLAAIAVREVMFGMILIVAFSVGLASVLTGIGVAIVLSRRLSTRLPILRGAGSPALRRVFAALPAASALGIALAGALITYQTIQQF